MDWRSGVQFLAGARDFSLLHGVKIGVKTGFEARSASYPMVVKRPGLEADY
jgi:hypothetical protein